MPPAARGGNGQRPADADSLSRFAAWLPDDQALATREQLRQIMALFPFASCVPFSSPVRARRTFDLAYRDVQPQRRIRLGHGPFNDLLDYRVPVRLFQTHLHHLCH